MVRLRFEIWETPLSQECSVASENHDRLRETEARFVEAFYASTHEEAMNYRYQRNGWGPYTPVPGVTDRPFTETQLSEQDAYLAVRNQT
jgi:hypothetical protein